jgi:hypothetical protein
VSDLVVTEETLTHVIELVREIERTGKAIPTDSRNAYLEAKQSIVDARRNAETHENPLQLCW